LPGLRQTQCKRRAFLRPTFTKKGGKKMRYWPTDKKYEYVREDGEIWTLTNMLKRDVNPTIVYDEDIQVPKIVYRTMERIFV
jgi:hypothetical protein